MGHFTNGVGIKTTIIYPPYLVSQNAPQGGVNNGGTPVIAGETEIFLIFFSI